MRMTIKVALITGGKRLAGRGAGFTVAGGITVAGVTPERARLRTGKGRS